MTLSQNARKLASIAFPGPWWTDLTYFLPSPSAGDIIKPGVRVRAPMGRGARVGIVTKTGASQGDYEGELKEITEVIDNSPALPESAFSLLRWFCDAYICGLGTAMKTLLPCGFLSGEAIEPPARTDCKNARQDDVDFVYEPVDAYRFERYVTILSDGLPSVVSFPLYSIAKKFFEYINNSHILSPEIKKRILLYPRLGGSAEWRTWKKLRSTDDDTLIVVGGQNSAMAPLPQVVRFIVDDESNNAWRTMRPPIYNVRSLISSRARIETASLVLGGRMPSPRAFLRYESMNPHAGNKYSEQKVIFVDMKLAYSPSVEGVTDGLAVSEPLVRETESALANGEWAIWILDRKGYAGEIICEECGAPIKCHKCGGTMRVKSSPHIQCVSCGAEAPTPDECPNCAGRLLSARRPGLDALITLADAAVVSPVPILNPGDSEEKVRKTISKSRAGVMLGTRATLALCDDVKVGMIGWIDADGEARSDEHDARTRAYSLIWESCWRGVSPQKRRVLVQTRRPGRDWQKGLEAGKEGWRIFWRSELRERREFSMPPYTSLVKAEGRSSDIGGIQERLDDLGYECWSPEENGKKSVIWIRTNKLSELRRIIAPYFHIKTARRGYPSVTVWHE
jgi:primosomal protein N' (replication factor Y)